MTYRVVVPVSGGKDSQSCLKLAVAKYSPSDVLGLFCDTQFEHPITYAHVASLRDLYGVEIATVTDGSVPEKVLKYSRFPGGGARHCTDELKITPSKKFYKKLAEDQGCGFEVWYGVRSDESAERKKRYAGKVCDEVYAPHEFMPRKYPKYLDKLGVSVRLPILDWSRDDVMYYLAGEENILYRQGFDRVGCFPCLASGDAYKNAAFTYDEFGSQQKAIVDELSAKIGKSIWTSKYGADKYEGAGCSLCAM